MSRRKEERGKVEGSGANLDGSLGALCAEVLEAHNLGHDEALLHVGVDATGRLRGARALLDRPGCTGTRHTNINTQAQTLIN